VQAFFAKLSEGPRAAAEQKYLSQHVTLGGLQYSRATGWLIFGKPAALSGRITNDGDRVIDGITVGLYFVDGQGRIRSGGEVLLTEIVRPQESISFRVTSKQAGFAFPDDAGSLKRIYQLVDLHFYAPPKKGE
ncbi:MAG: hypothetical protein ABI743_01415, partial [bacterium]